MSMKDLFSSWRGDDGWRDRATALAAIWPPEPGHAALEERMLREPGHGYHLAPAVAASLDALDEDARRARLYGFLLWQMERFPERFAASGFATEFAAHYADSFHRILDGIERRSLAADLRLDVFVKDLALTRLVLVPAVAQLIYPHGGIPLRPLFAWGPAGWAFVYGRCGGRRGFFEVHTHDPMAGDYFNAAGWEETYRLAALLFPSFPRHRGLVAYSWFYDPALETLSPRLGYLRHSPVGKGGRLMPMGADEDSARLATATSPSRRAAYEAGSYVPRRYGLIWSRADIMRHYS